MKQLFHGVPAGSSNSTPPHIRAVKYLDLDKLKALFIIALIAAPTLTIIRAQTLTIGTIDPDYEPGEQIEVRGTAPSEANLSLTITLDQALIYEGNVTAEEDGNYSASIDLPLDAEEGNYTITVSWGGESAEVNFTVINPDLEELAETLLDQAEDILDNVEDVFETLEEEGIGIPDQANTSYLQGLITLEEAEALFEVGEYSGAAEKATECIGYFGDAYEEAQTLIPTEEEDEGEDEEESLLYALERAYAFWERLNETVTRLEEDGYNVTRVREVLDEAEEKLINSSGLLSEGDFEGAREAFTTARRVLGRIQGFLKGQIKVRKERQAERFLEQFQRRIGKLNGVIERLRERLEEHKADSVKNALSSAAEKLQRLRQRLVGEELEDVLDELDDAIEDLDDAIETVNGKGFSARIKNMNRYEAKIQALNQSIERFQKKGRDTEASEDEMEEVEELLELLKDSLEDDPEEAEELVEELEKRLEELKDDLKGPDKDDLIEELLDKIEEKLEDRKGRGIGREGRGPRTP